MIRSLVVFLCLSGVLALDSTCSPKTRWKVLNTLFDAVPPPGATAPKPVSPSAGATTTVAEQSKGRKPPKVSGIPEEKQHDWDAVKELLPEDGEGYTDWVEAIRKGLITPWAGLNESVPPEKFFGYDLIFKAESEEDDALFPHTLHSEWLACSSCHPALFTGFDYIRGDLNMDAIDEGQYCGACHNTVAFPADNCNRCHPNQ